MLLDNMNKKCWRIMLLFIVLSFAFDGCNTKAPLSKNKVQFHFVEGTIGELHKSLETDGITCEEVVKGYINRIYVYDRDSTKTALKSVIMVNPHAIEEAKEMDKKFAKKGINKPLACVPVIVKDNINTKEMPTTGGAIAFKNNQPTKNAFIIRNLRRAGAIILGKANMDEFAFSTLGKSSIRGLVKNAYDLTKGAGGSSSGTATAVSASLAMAGVGTDTGSSIRDPASLAGLVGIRPSLRLVSQSGILPLAHWQDTAGPMCRTVQDCALMLDAMVGFDKSDRSNQRVKFSINARLINNKKEYKEVTNVPKSYADFLDPNGLQGARIGVVRALFGSNSIAKNIVNPVINAAIEKMRAAGATVKNVKIDDLHTILHGFSNTSKYEFKDELVRYLDSWPSTKDGHILSYKALVASGGYLPRNKRRLEQMDTIDVDSLTKEQRKVYDKNIYERPKFVRKRLMWALNNVNASGDTLGKPFDVLLYPEIISIAPKLGEKPVSGENSHLSPFSGFPALEMPAGMATNLKPAMPIGMELLAREFDEPTLIKIAYAYQEVAHPRKSPKNTPTLKSSTIKNANNNKIKWEIGKINDEIDKYIKSNN
jgi:Asp-tRNA(Asn)/Glu-tRNA(Gln) amidotransferase A subunit family amidase